MSEAAEPDWDAVRVDYLAGEMVLDDIAHKHGITKSALNWRRVHHGWPLRHPGPHNRGRSPLIARMFRVLERQLNLLDANMTEAGPTEVQMLGNMVRTLDKLMDLDKSTDKTTRSPKVSREIASMRQLLAERIVELERR